MLTVDGLLRGAVERGHGQRVGDVLARGQRIGLGLVERVGPRPGGVEGEVAVGAGQRGRRHRLEMVLAAVDVMDRELTRGARIAGEGIGKAAGLGDRGVLGCRCRDRGEVVGAGDVDNNFFGNLPTVSLSSSMIVKVSCTLWPAVDSSLSEKPWRFKMMSRPVPSILVVSGVPTPWRRAQLGLPYSQCPLKPP